MYLRVQKVKIATQGFSQCTLSIPKGAKIKAVYAVAHLDAADPTVLVLATEQGALLEKEPNVYFSP